MSKKILIVIFVLLTSNYFTYAFDNGDFQIWHKEKQSKKINDFYKIVMEEEFKFGDNAHDFYAYYIDAGLLRKINNFLDISLNYRQAYKKKDGKFKRENRPHLNFFLKGEWKGFEFEDRNRFMYRHFDYQDDYARYTNKICVVFPWKFSRFNIRPYIEEEAFINLNEEGFSENEFTAGFLMSLTKNIKAEIYYLLQHSQESDHWPRTNVFGTTLKISF